MFLDLRRSIPVEHIYIYICSTGIYIYIYIYTVYIYSHQKHLHLRNFSLLNWHFSSFTVVEQPQIRTKELMKEQTKKQKRIKNKNR